MEVISISAGSASTTMLPDRRRILCDGRDARRQVVRIAASEKEVRGTGKARSNVPKIVPARIQRYWQVNKR